MRTIFSNDTIQIEITNACILQCANCTRFVGHRKPYFMDWSTFKNAVDSMVGYPYMTGLMGGEPLLHPQFEKFCDYAVEKLGKEHLGLWTCFPKGYEKYREVICRTFHHIFVNDHSRPDIYHHPFLVASQEVVPDKKRMFLMIDNCFFQRSWSASVNPKGAYFCEIAASLSMLFDGSNGWKVEHEWWLKTPKDYTSQIEEFCPQCGGAICEVCDGKTFSLKRRSSIDQVDDISPGNLQRLKGKSKKIDAGKYAVSDLKVGLCEQHLAAYKDADYRAKIGARYGIFFFFFNFFGDDKLFLTPHLSKDFKEYKPKKPLFEEFKEAYGQ